MGTNGKTKFNRSHLNGRIWVEHCTLTAFPRVKYLDLNSCAVYKSSKCICLAGVSNVGSNSVVLREHYENIHKKRILIFLTAFQSLSLNWWNSFEWRLPLFFQIKFTFDALSSTGAAWMDSLCLHSLITGVDTHKPGIVQPDKWYILFQIPFTFSHVESLNVTLGYL